MGYREALEAAGATVHAFDYFGSYQGDWWAKVTWEGETGWVHGWFGSCSVCDAYEAEFGWSDPTPEQLASFGKQYLEDMIMTQEEAEKKASENLSWDLDAKEMYDFIVRHRETGVAT